MTKICCNDFLLATQEGTDLESNDSFIHMVTDNCVDMGWQTGTCVKDGYINYCPWCGADVRIKYEDLNMNMQELVCIGGPCHGIKMDVDVDVLVFVRVIIPPEKLTKVDPSIEPINEVVQVQHAEYKVEIVYMREGDEIYFLKHADVSNREAFVMYLEEMLKDET